MKNIHFKTCTCLLGMLLILFSGIQVKGASLEVQQESKISGTVTDEKGEPVIGASVVVVESMTALVLADALLLNMTATMDNVKKIYTDK